MHLFRILMVGFFSMTAVSLVWFQSVEVISSFIDLFFQNKK
ncbi:hypothetical protein [Anaerobacillus sp. 1_MG-2023]|nr:hypothetical protein [Anaerobacillus sp. 1_MG-2023]MDO6656655.1 hypothetical protein [Anaerobacillus sp. 1_MG-2023]